MYAKKIECPGCGRFLSDRVKECSCGWKKSFDEETSDPRCGFSLNGKRCSLPGTISGLPQKGSDWKCSYHFSNKNDFSWFQFIEKNLQEIIHFRKHYSTNFKNCARCRKLCDAEREFLGSQKIACEEELTVGW